MLRNNFGADSLAMLADLEYVSTAGRIAGWHRRLAEGDVGVDDLDVRSIHKQLFADVYEWAGCYRVTELRLGDDVFARQSSVHQMMDLLEETARGLAVDDAEHDAALADQLARLYADYNRIHPFREGNGRTGTLMLHIVATLRGRRLDLGRSSATNGMRHRATACRFAGTTMPTTGRFSRYSSALSTSGRLTRWWAVSSRWSARSRTTLGTFRSAVKSAMTCRTSFRSLVLVS